MRTYVCALAWTSILPFERAFQSSNRPICLPKANRQSLDSSKAARIKQGIHAYCLAYSLPERTRFHHPYLRNHFDAPIIDPSESPAFFPFSLWIACSEGRKEKRINFCHRKAGEAVGGC